MPRPGPGAVATGAAVWPLVNQMNPSADVQALSSIFVDVSGVEVGTQLTVKWRGKPVFVRRRTPGGDRRGARRRRWPTWSIRRRENANLPAETDASDQNRALDEAGEWLVMIGVCTHLGCVPLGNGAGDFGGWFCPCHGSHYDTVGAHPQRTGAAQPAMFRSRPSPTTTTIKLGLRETDHGGIPHDHYEPKTGLREVASQPPADRRPGL